MKTPAEFADEWKVLAPDLRGFLCVEVHKRDAEHAAAQAALREEMRRLEEESLSDDAALREARIDLDAANRLLRELPFPSSRITGWYRERDALLARSAGQGGGAKDLGSPEVEIGNPVDASPGSALGHGGQSAQTRKPVARESTGVAEGAGTVRPARDASSSVKPPMPAPDATEPRRVFRPARNLDEFARAVHEITEAGKPATKADLARVNERLEALDKAVVAKRCRWCQEPLEEWNRIVADGCPCNSGRGINHGLVPRDTCTCSTCDPAKTGGSRFRSDPQPEPPKQRDLGLTWNERSELIRRTSPAPQPPEAPKPGEGHAYFSPDNCGRCHYSDDKGDWCMVRQEVHATPGGREGTR